MLVKLNLEAIQIVCWWNVQRNEYTHGPLGARSPKLSSIVIGKSGCQSPCEPKFPTEKGWWLNKNLKAKDETTKAQLLKNVTRAIVIMEVKPMPPK